MWTSGSTSSFSQCTTVTFETDFFNQMYWLKLCSQVILKDVDSLLYVDTDVLFLRPMDDIWSLLKSFNGTQLAAMAPEHEVPKIGWYSRFARHPFYGVTGVNSGVMLMNLTRIRSTLFKVRSKHAVVLISSHSDQWKAKLSCSFSPLHSEEVVSLSWSHRLRVSEWAVIEAFWLPRQPHRRLPSELNLAALNTGSRLPVEAVM